MERPNKFISKLPTTSRPHPVRYGSHEEPAPSIAIRRPLSRRSKSVVDLRAPLRVANFRNPPTRAPTFTAKPPIPTRPALTTTKPVVAPTRLAAPSTRPAPPAGRAAPQTTRPLLPSKPSTLTMAGRGAVKRPAPTPAAAVKPKLAKPSKPAPYDYKARFGLLSEKYVALVQTHKELKARFTENEALLEASVNLTADYNAAVELNARYETELNALRDQVRVLTDRCDGFDRLKEEHAALTKSHSILKVKHEEAEIKTNFLYTKVKDLQATNLELRESVQTHEMARRRMHNEIQDLKGNIRVFCRVRPPLQHEQYQPTCNINFVDEETFDIQKSLGGKTGDSKLEFNFDKVFSPDASQAEVFEELSYLVQSALDGYNVCVFAYGQTGSGKTYTMQGGGDSQSSGLIPRTINLIFDLKTTLEAIGWVYTIEVSFLEIYNETIRDLIDPKSANTHEIKFNQGQGTTVTNLTVKQVNSAEELLHYLRLSTKNRATAATNFNEHSSRSHSVTKISINGSNDEMKICYLGSLNLVDLAGSESAKNSERMTETKNINKSLSTLGTVMSSLHKKEAHVPYRNSKLTFLLQSCLGGNSKTLMVVNIAPFDEAFSESVNSLRFASKVKEVKLGSRKNFNKPNLVKA